MLFFYDWLGKNCSKCGTSINLGELAYDTENMEWFMAINDISLPDVMCFGCAEEYLTEEFNYDYDETAKMIKDGGLNDHDSSCFGDYSILHPDETDEEFSDHEDFDSD